MRRVQFLDDGSGERISNHKALDQQNAQDDFDILSLWLGWVFYLNLFSGMNCILCSIRFGYERYQANKNLLDSLISVSLPETCLIFEIVKSKFYGIWKVLARKEIESTIKSNYGIHEENFQKHFMNRNEPDFDYLISFIVWNRFQKSFASWKFSWTTDQMKSLKVTLEAKI